MWNSHKADQLNTLQNQNNSVHLACLSQYLTAWFTIQGLLSTHQLDSGVLASETTPPPVRQIFSTWICLYSLTVGHRVPATGLGPTWPSHGRFSAPESVYIHWLLVFSDWAHLIYIKEPLKSSGFWTPGSANTADFQHLDLSIYLHGLTVGFSDWPTPTRQIFSAWICQKAYIRWLGISILFHSRDTYITFTKWLQWILIQ